MSKFTVYKLYTVQYPVYKYSSSLEWCRGVDTVPAVPRRPRPPCRQVCGRRSSNYNPLTLIVSTLSNLTSTDLTTASSTAH